MAAIKLSLVLILGFSILALSQEQDISSQDESGVTISVPDPSEVPASQPAAEDPRKMPAMQRELGTNDFERMIVAKLRKELPRLPSMYTNVHTCKLPDYGPVISVTVQPPVFYLTRPIMQELDRRQKIAAEQAKEIRSKIDQIIRMKAKEAEILSALDIQKASKKKNKASISDLEKELSDLRVNVKNLNTEVPFSTVILSSDVSTSDIDLEKMINASYQQLVQKVASAMKAVLAEQIASIDGFDDYQKVAINTHIRDNYHGNEQKNIIFVINRSDVEAFRAGSINLEQLHSRILVQAQKEE